VIYIRVRLLIPPPLGRYIKHFETKVEQAVKAFAAGFPDGARVLDAGAGEGQYKHLFDRHRYCGIDIGVGDKTWDYQGLDVRGDLVALPFADGSFAGTLNVVTLEHVTDPQKVVCELSRILAPRGTLLLVAPQDWEEHQQPHDYYRYTRYGLAHLLRTAGFTDIMIIPVGGVFRLAARRLLNAMEFLPTPLDIVLAAFFAIPGLLLPLFDRLDKRRTFTLGYICSARKPASSPPAS
jgi:SAM-dependent methyltransferase